MAVESRKDFFICNSGATAHMTHDKSRLHEVKPVSRSVWVGNRATVLGELAGRKDASEWW